MSDEPITSQDSAATNPFRETPVANSTSRHPLQFFAKTTIFYVGFFFLGSVGSGALALGIFSCFGILRKTDVQGGFIWIGLALLLLSGAAIYWFEIRSRRKPMIQLSRDGLELRLVRWGYSQFQHVIEAGDETTCFIDRRCREAFVPWRRLREAAVDESGSLVLTCEPVLQGSSELRACFSPIDLDFYSSDFIAIVINHYHLDASQRHQLPLSGER